MLKDASRRRFDVIMAWAIDRLGRSLIDLLGTIQHLEAAGVDLYLDQQAIDTTNPMGKLLFQITGAFAEFERTMIRHRIVAGIKTVKAAIATKGSFTARSSGIVRKRLGRPGADSKKVEAARRELEKGTGVLRTAKLVGLSTGTVQRLKQASIREGVYCSKARAPSSRMGAIGMGTAPPLTTIHNETPGIRKARYMAGGRGRRSSMSSS